MSSEPRSCRRATFLISASLDRGLTRRERLALRMHLLICGPCRLFQRQLRLLRVFVREHPPRALPISYLTARLTPEARARMIRALRGAAGDA
ncbi:MAG: zf-HC2 domain-containing protein [Planctomycetota bacterium]